MSEFIYKVENLGLEGYAINEKHFKSFKDAKEEVEKRVEEIKKNEMLMTKKECETFHYYKTPLIIKEIEQDFVEYKIKQEITICIWRKDFLDEKEIDTLTIYIKEYPIY